LGISTDTFVDFTAAMGGPVHREPPGGVRGLLDPAALGPAAHSVKADPEQRCGFLDPGTPARRGLTPMRRMWEVR
jgi:hypothetical protein